MAFQELGAQSSIRLLQFGIVVRPGLGGPFEPFLELLDVERLFGPKRFLRETISQFPRNICSMLFIILKNKRTH